MRDESAEEIARRSAADLTAHDYTIVLGEPLLDVELHVGDRGLEAGDDLNRLLLVPAVSGSVAGARGVVRRHDAVMHRGDAITVREIEQGVPHENGFADSFVDHGDSCSRVFQPNARHALPAIVPSFDLCLPPSRDLPTF